MEMSKKNLKSASICILILAALTLVRVIMNTIGTDFKAVAGKEGVAEGVAVVAGVVTCIISIVVLLPQIYVGIKGMKIAENPEVAGKAHIVWAIILTVVAVIGIFTTISDIAKSGNYVHNILALVSGVVDIILYFLYIKYAKQITKEA